MRTPTFFMVATFLVMLLAALTVRGRSESEVQRPIPASQWTPEARIWAARSCIGEAGFGSMSKPQESMNECISILGVYARRYWEIRDVGLNWSLLKVIKRYSAAIKPSSTHRRPWLLELDESGSAPAHWPDSMSWKRHEPLWRQKLMAVDSWANGDVQTLTPDANHYGGPMDHYGDVCLWKRVKTPAYYRNLFYDSTKSSGIRMEAKERMFGRVVVPGSP